MDLLMVIEKMISLFLMILIGYAANKAGILDKTGNQRLSALILNICCPLLIVSAVAGGNASGSKSEAFMVLGLAFLLYIALGVISLMVPRLFHVKDSQKGLFQFMTIFPNVGFMGFPVAQVIFGTESLFYASMFNLAFNLLAFTLGVYLIQKDVSDGTAGKINWKKICNMGTLMAVLAMLIYLLDIKLPDVIADTCSIVGNATTPLSMIVIGSTMAGISLKSVFTDGKAYLFSIMKVILIPGLFWLVGHLFIENPIVLGLLVIIAGMPCASITAMFAIEYHSDADTASRYVFMTTLMSFLSIPVLALLLSM
ncbi:AEC family transporter [Diplocloster hominis]|uniref:AEC family transporter n=1 Tax=Diplocloster hominis TaxID=3079010 RepID=UPI0031BBA8A3